MAAGVAAFPARLLNGSQLDLFALYKLVVARGGFANGVGIAGSRKMRGGIRWSADVFPRMRK